MVGDSAQAIYHWRGANDAMAGFNGTRLVLSQSFRFGPALAEEANRWLRLADAPIRLTGTTAIPTELGTVKEPDAVLCRTNVGAMAQVMTYMAAGRRVALAGGGNLQALALAARDVKEGRCLVAGDFARDKDPAAGVTGDGPAPAAPVDEVEARLAYVAVTRARQRLDLGGLSWIRDHPDGSGT